MSTPPTETPATETPDPGTDPTTPQAPEQDVQDVQEPAGTEDHASNREAAKYRRQLRDTETERDGLRDQLTALRRQVVESASGLARPQALWLTDLDVNTLFTDEGTLDTARTTEAVARISSELGLREKPRTPAPDPSQGMVGLPPSSSSWADVVRGRATSARQIR